MNTKNILQILSIIIVLILVCSIFSLDKNNKIDFYTDEQIDFFEENFDDQILYDGWKIYRNDNYKFGIQIPEEWNIKENKGHVSFGAADSFPGGGFWGISIYPISELKNLDEIISSIGQQFEDRKERIVDISNSVKKVIITTNEKPDWFSEKYIIQSKEYIYILGNGAVKNEEFEKFFESFGIIY